MKTIDCWHFAGETLRDGRPLPRAGEPLVHEGEVEICASGFHGSEKALDASYYAPGPRVARVRLIDVVESHDDKHVARQRLNLTDYVDATDVLRAFARRCALDVIHLWDAPDVVRRYLETGDDALRAAAEAAAWVAARAAAWAAAQDAAWAAAQDAAWAAAGAAAGAAAEVAGVAGAAARAEQDRLLTTALGDLVR